jgi:hypothetical protein
VTIRAKLLVAVSSDRQSFTERPEPEPPCFSLADAQRGGDFSD